MNKLIDPFEDFKNIDSKRQDLNLGDRQKMYEKILDFSYNPNFPIIIRLDGKNFSKRTKQWKLEKPFDERFNQCMIAASIAIFDYFQNVEWIWTGSDEISIIMKKDEFFSNRIQKIVSISASIASVSFNFKALEVGLNVKEFPAVFDGRLTILPNDDEIYRNIIFRQNDCIRNSISQYARLFYSSKQLISKQRQDQFELLKEKGFDWEKDAPDWAKFGTKLTKVYKVYDNATKKVKYEVDANNVEFDNATEYIRSKIKLSSKKF